MLKLFAPIIYKCRKHPFAYAIGVLLFIGLLTISYQYHHYPSYSYKWLEILDLPIGIGTFVIAILVWFQESKENWQQNLPKRLTVSFKFDGVVIMRCEKAYLASEADIRAWSQQIGSQMAGGQSLKFNILIEQDNPSIEQNQLQQYFQHYRVTFHLMALPNSRNKEHSYETERRIFKQSNQNPPIFEDYWEAITTE